MADKAAELATQTDDIEEFLRQIIACGDEVLSQTPEMLPVLKQAGVVDSGGQGLMEVMKGGLDGLLGRGIPSTPRFLPESPRSSRGRRLEGQIWRPPISATATARNLLSM